MATIDKNKFQFVKRDDFASEVIDAPAYSYWKSVFRQFLKKRTTIIMLAILIGILLMSFVYPMFSKFDYNDVSKVNDFSARLNPPSGKALFGTDNNGKSLFDGVWFGARNSIIISFIATVINVVVGVIVGGIWGISKSIDRIMMEVYNVISNIPFMLIVIVLTYSMGSGFWNLILAMSLTGWIGIAYTIRVQIMRYRDLEYNLASRTLGTPTLKIVTKNILPQLVSVIVTQTSQLLPSFISYEAFLSFFGLGLPITVPSLGRLISDYSQNVTTNAYLFWIPLTVLIGILLMSFVYPMFSNFDYNDVSKVNDFSARLNPPSAKAFFGTDNNGKSLFDGVWFGARNSIIISFIATVINVVVGVIVGGIWGISKSIDRIMMEVYNVISNIPFMLIVIVLTYSMGSGFWNLILAMSLTGWIGIAYTIRVQIMRYRDLEYNLASRTLGTPTMKIVTKNILPQLVSVIVTQTSQMLPSFISYEAFLSFFGLGLPITVPSLGRLISDYSQNVTTNAYLFWIPLTVLILVSLSFFIVGQNLADASDPRTHR